MARDCAARSLDGIDLAALRVRRGGRGVRGGPFVPAGRGWGLLPAAAGVCKGFTRSLGFRVFFPLPYPRGFRSAARGERRRRAAARRGVAVGRGRVPSGRAEGCGATPVF